MNFITSLRSSILVIAAMTGGVSSAQSAGPLEQDLAQIMAWWPGTYNNDRQIAEVENADEESVEEVWRADGSGQGGYLNVTSHYIPIDLPELGEHVLYVEEYRDGQPDVIYRQRIYSLSIDEDEDVIRVNIANFKDRKKYLGAYADLSLLAGLTADDLAPFPENCDLLVEQKGSRYHLAMRNYDCAFGGRAFSYEVMLSADSFWFHDKITRLEDGAIVMTMANYNYHKMDRVD